MSDLEFIVELLIRMDQFDYRLYEKLPKNFNKGRVTVNLTFEDGELKEGDIY